MTHERTIEASCHCGAVRIEVAAAPSELNDCGCSICRRMGTLWAYYRPDEVRIAPPSGATDVYMWGPKQIEFHRCRVCGNVTHWAPADRARPRMGINARLMEPAVVAAAQVRKSSGP
jgi:hypothetical protein